METQPRYQKQSQTLRIKIDGLHWKAAELKTSTESGLMMKPG